MFVYIPVCEYFSFANIIHPHDRCGISRSWLNSMIITQVHLVLGTIKRPLKCAVVSQRNATDVSSWGSVQLAWWLQECPPELSARWMYYLDKKDKMLTNRDVNIYVEHFRYLLFQSRNMRTTLYMLFIYFFSVFAHCYNTVYTYHNITFETWVMFRVHFLLFITDFTCFGNVNIGFPWQRESERERHRETTLCCSSLLFTRVVSVASCCWPIISHQSGNRVQSEPPCGAKTRR